MLFSSDRNGVNAIFKQRLDADSAPELVIGGPEPVVSARLSADQQWILYLVRPRPAGGKPQPTRLMRLPVAGGAPELILESLNLVPVGSRCARAPATLCACIENAGNKRVIFQLDPLQGKGRELFRIPVAQADADISPDATRFAYLVPGGKANRIAFVNASGHLEREVEVEGWAGIDAMDSRRGRQRPLRRRVQPSHGRDAALCGPRRQSHFALESARVLPDLGHPIARRPLPRNADPDYRQQCVDHREFLRCSCSAPCRRRKQFDKRCP